MQAVFFLFVRQERLPRIWRLLLHKISDDKFFTTDPLLSTDYDLGLFSRFRPSFLACEASRSSFIKHVLLVHLSSLSWIRSFVFSFPLFLSTASPSLGVSWISSIHDIASLTSTSLLGPWRNLDLLRRALDLGEHSRANPVLRTPPHFRPSSPFLLRFLIVSKDRWGWKKQRI